MICFLIIAATLAYVYWRLARSNMDVPPRAEIALSRREALHFALDNNLPIK